MGNRRHLAWKKNHGTRRGQEKRRREEENKRIGAMAPSGRGMKTPLPLQILTQRLPLIEK